MEKFETFVARHGETGAQAILENWERHMGIRYVGSVSLEHRWEIFLRETSYKATRSAA